MKYFKKLEGENIYLSPINNEDIEKYVYFLNDKNVTNNIGTTNEITTIESEKEWITNANKNNTINLAIIKKENDELIGNCSLFDIDRINRCCTLGIFIGEEQNRNKGYGKETINLLLDYGFNYQNMHNINLKVFSFNERAIKCYEKVGFKKCGTRHESYFLEGKYYDEIIMEILENDYRNR